MPSGALRIFDVPGAREGTYVEGINNAGKIVGHYEDSAGRTNSFSMNADGTDFRSFDICNYEPAPGLAEGTYATAINNRGQIAGFCFLQSGEVGFIEDPNGTVSTYGFDPNPTFGDITNTQFRGINDEDVVTGLYEVNGRTTSFIASPIPEPSALWLTGMLVAICIWLRRGCPKDPSAICSNQLV